MKNEERQCLIVQAAEKTTTPTQTPTHTNTVPIFLILMQIALCRTFHPAEHLKVLPLVAVSSRYIGHLSSRLRREPLNFFFDRQ